RAARNVRGRVLMYADVVTESMRRAISEMNRRREIQAAYNAEHGITPETIVKPVDDLLKRVVEADYFRIPDDRVAEATESYGTTDEVEAEIEALTARMLDRAKALDFEEAAALRDRIAFLKKQIVYG